MSDFSKFSLAITQRFNTMSKQELFATVDGHELYEKYLASFPAGTNPIFRERTEHDCSCCKQFIRNIGNVVQVIDGQLTSVWDVPGLESPYAEVAAALGKFVTSAPITGLYRMPETKYGAVFTLEALDPVAGEAAINTRRWNHLHGEIAARHFSKTVDKARGDYRTTAEVFARGLKELSASAITTVLELIEGKALYRGEEHLPAIRAFQALQSKYGALKTGAARDAFVWSSAGEHGARFKNTVIGSLIEDLSGGTDIEAAVSSFEAKVAPMNYKRPTALITPGMVKDALKTISELGLDGALKRRFAVISDVSVNNVLWVDRAVKAKMKDGLEELLMTSATLAAAATSKEKPEQISIEEFMETIVPKSTEMEVFVKNTMVPNFMSLTAPVESSVAKLFKWDNDFAWSYEGNITDSIKEKVKRAGGNVTNAKMRVSLAWHNFDDLDIHMHTPTGEHIYFGNKAGKLDVDMNAGGRSSREPVENISFTTLMDGVYSVQINQYSQRETVNVGFELEVENNGSIQQYTYSKAVKGNVSALSIKVEGGKIKTIVPHADLVGGTASKDHWGVATENFVKVNTLMKSPNYWDENTVGNRHWFFILEGCKNSMPTRGIYNEFLDSKLEKHRKVFEILGDKTKCQPADEQLSGVGFSSTKGESVLVRVAGPKTRKTFSVNF